MDFCYFRGFIFKNKAKQIAFHKLCIHIRTDISLEILMYIMFSFSYRTVSVSFPVDIWQPLSIIEVISAVKEVHKKANNLLHNEKQAGRCGSHWKMANNITIILIKPQTYYIYPIKTFSCASLRKHNSFCFYDFSYRL